jgi:phosphoglycolate phosphatase
MSPASTKLFGIDLDGTLEDSRTDMVAAARRVRAALELPIRSDAALRPFVNAGMDQLYRACFDDYLAQTDADAYQRVRRAYEADYLAHVVDDTRLYPGIADALAALSQLGTLACITNKPEHISRRLLEALGVSQFFAAVVGGDSCSHAKPHPVMLQTAAERCGFDRQHGQTFMIGDTNADMQLGRAFGARCVWCAWGYVDVISEPADFHAEEPSDLPRILAS